MRIAVLLLALAGLAADWPAFRGPGGQGVAPADADPPLTWSATESVAWSAEVPGDGWSSPVVAGGRVFVTSATDGGKSCRLLAFDAVSGKPLFDQEVSRQAVKRMEGRNSPATPTPVVAGDRVVAAFNDGTVVAASSETGAVLWANRDFPYYSQHGLGASPVRYKELVIMPFDGSSEGPDKAVGWQTPWDKALVVAFELATGKVRWKTPRGPSRIAHATPVLATTGGRDTLVSPAGDVIQGLDPATGELLWTVKTAGEGLVPSPSVAGTLAFATTGFGEPTLKAVRLDGTGVAWQDRRRVSMMPSMLAAGGRLYVVTDKGFAACLDAETGKVVWEERLGGSFSASPVLAAGRVYALSDAGETVVFRAADAFEELARNKLGEPAQASPAVVEARLYVRTKGRLWCVGR